MKSFPTYSFSLRLEKGTTDPCFSIKNSSLSKYSFGNDFNEWFFSSVGQLLQKHESTGINLVVDFNLFKVLNGSENWLNIAAQAVDIKVFSVNSPNKTNDLYNRFIQVILYKLLYLHENMEYKNEMKPTRNIEDNILKYYYSQYLKGKLSVHEFINKCSLQEVIISSKPHDGLYDKACGTTINPIFKNPGNTVFLDKAPAAINSLGLVYFCNHISGYEYQAQLSKNLNQCFSSKSISVDAQEEIELFINFFKQLYHGL